MSIKVVPKARAKWAQFHRRRIVGAAATPLATRDATFFVMGSCFAKEIRGALDLHLGPGHVLPDFSSLAFDPAVETVDQLPVATHLNTYNPFSVLQEFQRIRGDWRHDPTDYWHAKGGVQCPYRRLVLAPDAARLAEITRDLDAIMRAGFAAADHFVFTFGMTEVFVNRHSGKIANQKPGYLGGGGQAETEYRRATFAEVKGAILDLVDLIAAAKPKAKVFMTVSPVGLARTFSGEDVYVANTASKATLRAALAEVADERDQAVYFPSYEAVMSDEATAFQDDGRHVRPEVVSRITATFCAAFLHPAEARAAGAREISDA